MENISFKLVSTYKPTGDQPKAIKELLAGLKANKKFQVLLGATGTGKTFTMANIIANINKPTLILVHNKTLAGQLYSEFKELFPENRVEYFVSNFDFYQPEAYMPASDTYIGKEAVMNDEIEMLRTSAINSVLHRNDTIIVASVASIYGLTDPEEYARLVLEVRVGEKLDRQAFFASLIEAQYQRDQMEIASGKFRVKGDLIEVMSADSDQYSIRIDTFDDTIQSIDIVNYLTGEVKETVMSYPIFPAYDHANTHARIKLACSKILRELEERITYFKTNNKPLEEERIELRTRQDVDSLNEFGMCPGIENYSRHIDGRKEGEQPFCLMDYFPKDYLLIVDESHVTLPQIRGMYNGDRARKTNLVDYGFRLPSALDNRPLKFEEFENEINNIICTSATPGDYELGKTNGEFVEQIIRPTGLLDPVIMVRPSLGQIDDLINEINNNVSHGERTMIITLTIKMSEDLTAFLKTKGIKVAYLHSECKTLERTQIIYELRKGKYDVLVGINLLREGLDIPEVSLIAIIDADKEGFLRSSRSLIQIIGRAARNERGRVIMYADNYTDSMKIAIDETNRRRDIQEKFNEETGQVPTTIIKPIREPIHNTKLINTDRILKKTSKKDISREIIELRKQMKKAADEFDFEKAIELRDIIFELQSEIS
ncbi:MAG: excinuclease ABC subunit UvrB [Bacilli bacterium]